jgi:hypothetical protein
VAANETDVMQIVFHDSDDVSDDDPTNSVCFNDVAAGGACGPITIDFLKSGGAIWDRQDFCVEIAMTPK